MTRCRKANNEKLALSRNFVCILHVKVCNIKIECIENKLLYFLILFNTEKRVAHPYESKTNNPKRLLSAFYFLR